MKLPVAILILATGLRAAAPVEILVQGAEALEIRDVLPALGPGAETVRLGPYVFHIGEIGGHRVAVTYTGQALINCTASTILAIEEFHPRIIINQGTSGSQSPTLHLHDVIVGRRCLDYGNFRTAPRAVGEGSAPLTWTSLPQRMRNPANDRLEDFPGGFEGDAALLDLALHVPNPSGRVLPGVIGSAHEVNLELDRVRWTHDTFGMDVEEMESGHVAALAYAYGIRYIAFRVVSDAPFDKVDFEPEAARVTALYTVAFLQHLPELPAHPQPPR